MAKCNGKGKKASKSCWKAMKKGMKMKTDRQQLCQKNGSTRGR